jgi:acyl-CoA dehydrogenase
MTYTSAWMDEDLAMLAKTASKFFETNLVAARQKHEAQRHVDRDVWRRAGALGLLCCSIPEEYGGGGGSILHDLVVLHEQASCLDTSWGNSVHSGVVAHNLLAYGTEEQRRRWLPGMASGELVGAIAMSEPGAGSDLQGIRTRAVLHPDGHYRISGSKTFISNGSQADIVIVVAKTDPAARRRGISLIVVETAHCPGFQRGRILDKIGQHGADTSELFFDEALVPAANLLGGVEGRGFVHLTTQLAQERLLVSVRATAVTARAVEETVAYTKQRNAFGKPLFDLQNTRFELAECATLAHISRVFLDSCIERHMAGRLDASTAAMAKYWLTDIQCQVIDRCVQLHGGYGYMTEYPIARMYADARPTRIYAGANEIMKEIIARSL